MAGLPDFDPDDVIDSEVIEHSEPTNDRSAARQVALQVLYEVDSTGHRVGDVLNSQAAFHHLNNKAGRYLDDVVMGVTQHYEKLDAIIQRFAPEFPLQQVAIIDRNILRIALYELGIESRVPMRVAIDEAVQLAKIFGAEGTPRFVNGVLGTIAENYESIRLALGAGAQNPEDDLDEKEN